ncbi:hypothetical protein LTR05_006509 [Lithohypha guttulata]|uniref:Amidase domain-containing protein n=2 Tax=Lithohypha guttulata TaxID=1690604 RepID=A0AAN7Y991_9EURO|nr:hypothetical protein LTR05_006509 [Lithohypha guttulata]
MKGSPFGWATEIAGSTRIPAIFNNLFAIRVSTGRLSALGIASSNQNLPLCNTTVGMISYDLSFLQHMCRLTLGATAYQEDPAWLDMPWREARFQEVESRKPTFAVLLEDQHVRPQPPLQRALRHLTQSLRAQGYEVVAWQPPSHKEAVETLFRMIGADGAKDIRANIASSGEPPVPQLKKWFFEHHDPPNLSVSEYWALCKSRMDYIAAYHSYWLSSKQINITQRPIDGVIMPVVAQVACYENELNYFGYSAIVNLLDFTSVALPVTFVDRDRDLPDTRRVMLNAEDAQIQTSYDPSTFHGMPVGIQIMCRRAEEEVALALANIVSEVYRRNGELL